MMGRMADLDFSKILAGEPVEIPVDELQSRLRDGGSFTEAPAPRLPGKEDAELLLAIGSADTARGHGLVAMPEEQWENIVWLAVVLARACEIRVVFKPTRQA